MNKKLLIAAMFCIGLNNFGYSQDCGNCKLTPSVALYDVDVQVEPPKLKGTDSTAWLEWLQLFWVGKHTQAALYQANKSCIRFTQPIDASISGESVTSKDDVEIPPLVKEGEYLNVGASYTNLPPNGDLSKFGNYITTGFLKRAGDGYTILLEIQAACTRKTVVSASHTFKIYESSKLSITIAQQLAGALSPLIEKIKQFEINERLQNEKTALDDLFSDAITIKPKKRNLAAGEQTELEISLKDCDGFPLANREIVFTKGSLDGILISAGTIGGTVIPGSVITDASGKAKANFKMGSAKTAIIDAYHIYDKPYGCQSVKLGSTPINGIPVKVEVSYSQNETKTIKRATLPGVKISGGDESEQYIMFHNSVLYYYPSEKELKDGYLIMAENDSEPGVTEYILETGYYEFTKSVSAATIKAMIGNVEAVQDVEEGSHKRINGTAGLEHHSEINFMKGNGRDPGAFAWSIQYPAKPEGEIAYGSMMIVEGEEGVEWKINKITDPTSPYKTEYLLKLKLDANKELKAGEKAMKELFGFDLDGLTGIIDPTNPQASMAGASGSQTMIVRILSPFPAH